MWINSPSLQVSAIRHCTEPSHSSSNFSNLFVCYLHLGEIAFRFPNWNCLWVCHVSVSSLPWLKTQIIKFLTPSSFFLLLWAIYHLIAMLMSLREREMFTCTWNENWNCITVLTKLGSFCIYRTRRYHINPPLEATRTVRYDASIPSLFAHRTMDEASLHWVLLPRRVPYKTTIRRYRMWRNVTIDALACAGSYFPY
jgi:hypothetical protein